MPVLSWELRDCLGMPPIPALEAAALGLQEGLLPKIFSKGCLLTTMAWPSPRLQNHWLQEDLKITSPYPFILLKKKVTESHLASLWPI